MRSCVCVEKKMKRKRKNEKTSLNKKEMKEVSADLAPATGQLPIRSNKFVERKKKRKRK